MAKKKVKKVSVPRYRLEKDVWQGVPVVRLWDTEDDSGRWLICFGRAKGRRWIPAILALQDELLTWLNSDSK